MNNDVLNLIIDDYITLYRTEKEKRQKLQERIDTAIEYIKEYGRDKQLEEDYLMSRYNLAIYNTTLLEILEVDDKND